MPPPRSLPGFCDPGIGEECWPGVRVPSSGSSGTSGETGLMGVPGADVRRFASRQGSRQQRDSLVLLTLTPGVVSDGSSPFPWPRGERVTESAVLEGGRLACHLLRLGGNQSALGPPSHEGTPAGRYSACRLPVPPTDLSVSPWKLGSVPLPVIRLFLSGRTQGFLGFELRFDTNCYLSCGSNCSGFDPGIEGPLGSCACSTRPHPLGAFASFRAPHGNARLLVRRPAVAPDSSSARERWFLQPERGWCLETRIWPWGRSWLSGLYGFWGLSMDRARKCVYVHKPRTRTCLHL